MMEGLNDSSKTIVTASTGQRHGSILKRTSVEIELHFVKLVMTYMVTSVLFTALDTKLVVSQSRETDIV